ncbi:hypothetical protein [Burkholderia anthina]|uniref:hypothetical protein n=1 Tax=Burkholderia anthina TaxID=179879 RepID=UPI00158A9114|nr:hypothetical protein [Burkholderia anthina]
MLQLLAAGECRGGGDREASVMGSRASFPPNNFRRCVADLAPGVDIDAGIPRKAAPAAQPSDALGAFPVRGMTREQLAKAAKWHGVEGSADALIAFACEMQRAVARAA